VKLRDGYLRCLERLLEIAEDVVHVLDADGEGIISGFTPARTSSSSVSWRWVVDAGCKRAIFASPILTRRLNSFNAS